MFGGTRLAMSLPAPALHRPRAAVLPLGEVLAMPLDPALAAAVRVVAAHAADMAQPPLVVVRPEMFVEGESLDWLRARLAGVEEHVAISDGAVAKAIPGLVNHILFCGLDDAAAEARFDRLVARAATAFAGFATQIGSARAIRSRRHAVRLPSMVLPALRSADADDGGFRRFYYNLHSNEESRAWIGSMAPLGWEDLAGFDAVTIVSAPSALLAERRFDAWLVARLQEAYYRPETCLLIQLPAAPGDDGLDLLLDAIRASGRLLPRMPAGNILLTRTLPATAPLRYFRVPCTLVLNDASPLWAYTPADYAVFDGIRILLRRGRTHRERHAAMAEGMLGRTPALEWLERPA